MKITIIEKKKCKDVIITLNNTLNNKNIIVFNGGCTLELREDGLIIEKDNDICWYRKEIIDIFSYRKER